MTNPVMDRARQRLLDQLAQVSDDVRKLEAENADRLEEWRLAREAARENEAGPAGQVDATHGSDGTGPAASEASSTSDDGEEGEDVRIEARRTSGLIEQLERVRPESMEDRGVPFRGR